LSVAARPPRASPSWRALAREHSLIARTARALRRIYKSRLTGRGRFLFWTLLVCGFIGMDTRRSQVFVVFAGGAGLFVTAALLSARARPKVRVDCELPARLTAGLPLTLMARLENRGESSIHDLALCTDLLGRNDERVELLPQETFVDLAPHESLTVPLQLTVSRRGPYCIQGLSLARIDPLRLIRGRAITGRSSSLLAYPRYYTVTDFTVPAGRRYQPGGVPLSSSLGDSIEFVGTREYREGDPLRNIHWRSWARRGEPVVKEYQEEYFSRIALILDTFLPRNPTPAQSNAFEAAISVLASVADHFGRGEHIIDILAAGPDIYEVSAGRSLAYLDNILEVLACLEPCNSPPFEAIGPHLLEKLAQLTTVVAVLLDWDARREGFLTQVKALGTSVTGIVVHPGPTTQDWQQADPALGSLQFLAPTEVATLLERAQTHVDRV
jgi:uncharacterized protein (DUF58 family)